jgi:hypothetical protein
VHYSHLKLALKPVLLSLVSAPSIDENKFLIDFSAISLQFFVLKQFYVHEELLRLMHFLHVGYRFNGFFLHFNHARTEK